MSVDLSLSAVVKARPHEPAAVADSFVERIGAWCGMALLASMLVLIGGEVVIRNLFGISWEGTDEFGGYMLVALTFVSLPVCVCRGGLHEMQLLRARLSPRGVAGLDLVLHLLSLGFMAVLVWQFGRMEMLAWNTGDVSTTNVRTPLWIPRLFMVVGSAALCITLIRLMIADLARLASAGGD